MQCCLIAVDLASDLSILNPDSSMAHCGPIDRRAVGPLLGPIFNPSLEFRFPLAVLVRTTGAE